MTWEGVPTETVVFSRVDKIKKGNPCNKKNFRKEPLQGRVEEMGRGRSRLHLTKLGPVDTSTVGLDRESL